MYVLKDSPEVFTDNLGRLCHRVCGAALRVSPKSKNRQRKQ
jgi:hypothetical protein